ncbi:WD40 repeat domain-containing protein [Rivularia sp. UHCC 0363]|uniref:WD40 repeat domain-containing protein n=1 Tax=Rivularia sp. UHCC 0363 TaxID=3110244 RepID=UPI002B20F185|nr:WD40 repeat domain-containing protein [Rivularia sp. UHCC 0363]MEA5597832.1 WD40 repeat domain-containing protein [Rivularia sp. UHCC 0363]
MDVNSINLLKAQQADFLERIKKPKTHDITLLESSVKGCHREFMAFWGEGLTSLLEKARLQAEILAINPPPVPSEYPENPDWAIPFVTYFQHQAEDYLLRELIVEEVMKGCFGKLVKKIPQDALNNIGLDDEGNLRGESKFSFLVTDNPEVKIRVCVADSESFNGIKKDKVRWTITQEDLNNYQILFFLCLFFPGSGQRGYEKEAVITGFLPANQIEFNGLQTHVKPSKLLYAGGLNWYLNVFKNQQMPNEAQVIQEAKTMPICAEHSSENIIGEWQCLQTLVGHINGINCIALKPKDKSSSQSLIASGSRGEIKLWDLQKSDLIATLSEYPWVRTGVVDEVNYLAFSPDGQTLASGGADSTIKMWHLGAKDLIDIMHKHNGMVRCVAFTPNGRMLATGGDDRKIQFWDMTERQVSMTLSLDDTAAHSLIFSQDGKTLITGSYRKIKVWEICPNQELSCVNAELQHSFAGHSHIVRSLAMTRDGKILVSASRDKTIKIWHLKTGQLLRTLEGHIDGVYAVALSQDEQIIASGSADKTIKLWHLETGELLNTFTGHTNTVTAVAFADKNILVSGSLDKTIKIWQRI